MTYKNRKAAFTRSAIMVLWNVTPLLVTMLTFGIYVGMGKELTASVAFSSLALFNVMRFPLNIFPMLIAQLVEAKISVKRYSLGLQLSTYHFQVGRILQGRGTRP